MEPYRPLRGGLFVYECFRLLFLTAVFAALRPGAAGFPWLVYAAPNALFTLMALFLWLNLSRYGTYLPLFLAGKIISLFSILGWAFFLRGLRGAELSFLFMPELMTGILLCGDTFAAAAVYCIIKKIETVKQEIISLQTTIQATTLPVDTPVEEGE
jgi:hypothetical protein